MLPTLLQYLGYMLIILFGAISFLGVAFATPGHVGDHPAAKFMAKAIGFMFYAVPLWAITCYKGFENAWLLGAHAYIWIPLTLAPLLLIFILFKITEQAQN